jgi:hypothetical protein
MEAIMLEIFGEMAVGIVLDIKLDVEQDMLDSGLTFEEIRVGE